jgi:hypothetical protein
LQQSGAPHFSAAGPPPDTRASDRNNPAKKFINLVFLQSVKTLITAQTF